MTWFTAAGAPLPMFVIVPVNVATAFSVPLTSRNPERMKSPAKLWMPFVPVIGTVIAEAVGAADAAGAVTKPHARQGCGHRVHGGETRGACLTA
jgi:hypothetical protein